MYQDHNITMNYIQSFRKTSKFSRIHMSIRSVPLQFTECLSYLDTQYIDFISIPLSETTINSSHINYNIPNYNMEIHFRKRNKGGGVNLYIQNQY